MWHSRRALGISVHVARLPDIDPDVFDAILFTRSLHHILDLGSDVGRAASLLRPGGQIIVEDFAFDSAVSDAPYLYRYVEQAADAETAGWCFDVECAAGEKGQISLLGRRLVGICEG